MKNGPKNGPKSLDLGIIATGSDFAEVGSGGRHSRVGVAVGVAVDERAVGAVETFERVQVAADFVGDVPAVGVPEVALAAVWQEGLQLVAPQLKQEVAAGVDDGAPVVVVTLPKIEVVRFVAAVDVDVDVDADDVYVDDAVDVVVVVDDADAAVVVLDFDAAASCCWMIDDMPEPMNSFRHLAECIN